MKGDLFTSEMLATSPPGTIVVTKDGMLAYRKCSAKKTDWERLRPTADGWESNDPVERGPRVFVLVVNRLHHEPLYVLRED